MVSRLAVLAAGGAFGTGLFVSTRGESQAVAKDRQDWSKVEAEKHKSRAADAIARGDQAKAAAEIAKAQAETSKANAAAETARIEASDRSAQRAHDAALDRERAAGQIDAAKFAKAEKDAEFVRNKLTGLRNDALLGGAIGVGIGALAAGVAFVASRGRVRDLNALGQAASKIMSAKGIVAGTPKGDKLAGTVKAAEQIGGKIPFSQVGQMAPSAKRYLPAGEAVIGAGALAGAAYTDDPALRATLLTVGVAGLGAAAGTKLATTIAGRLPTGVAGKNVAAIQAGKDRLSREASSGAGRIGKAKIGQQADQAEGSRAIGQQGIKGALKIGDAKIGKQVDAAKAGRKQSGIAQAAKIQQQMAPPPMPPPAAVAAAKTAPKINYVRKDNKVIQTTAGKAQAYQRRRGHGGGR